MPRNIFVLTGAGISAESGLGTFRDKRGEGVWARFDPMKLATPEAFARDPETVLAFYDLRRRNLLNAKPNAAHFALARLEGALAEHGDCLTLVTQNIDDLHERASSASVIHMHGELLKARCGRCEAVHSWLDDLTVAHICPNCGDAGALRPHVVWFGEMPLALDLIDQATQGRPFRRHRHFRLRLSRCRIRRRGARLWVAHLRDQPRGGRQRGPVRRAALGPGKRDGSGWGRGARRRLGRLGRTCRRIWPGVRSALRGLGRFSRLRRV